MPELPEVETIVRGLKPLLENRHIASVVLNRADLRRPFPENLAEKLTGKRVVRVRRRAKYILCDITRDITRNRGREVDRDETPLTLLIHLGMSGRVFADAPTVSVPPRKHEHMIVCLESGHRLALVDPRRFGVVDLYETGHERETRYFQTQGLEPLDPDEFTLVAFAEKLSRKRMPIKTALLDQKLVAGLGNIYVCEALFRAGVHPESTAADIAADVTALSLKRLWEVIPEILQEAISAGGSTLRDYVQADGKKGAFQTLHRVYGREGEVCVACGSAEKEGRIKRIVQSGRSTFFCPRCQKV